MRRLTNYRHTLLCISLAVMGTHARWSIEWSAEHSRQYYFNRRTGESSWETQHNDESAVESKDEDGEPTGWRDCTLDAESLFSSGGLQRAWRRLSRAAHPDKGGTTESFQAITEARDYLRSPLRFFAHRQLHGASPTDMLPLGGRVPTTSASLAQRVHAAVEMRDGWPFITLDVEISTAGRSGAVRNGVGGEGAGGVGVNLSRSVYQLALAAKV